MVRYYVRTEDARRSTGAGTSWLPESVAVVDTNLIKWGLIASSDSSTQWSKSFHSTIDTPPGVPGVSKYSDDQNEVYSGELEY